MSIAVFLVALLVGELAAIVAVLVFVTARLGRLPDTRQVMAMIVAVGSLAAAAVICWAPVADMPAPTLPPATYAPVPGGWGTR